MIKKNVVGIIIKNKKILLQLRDNKKHIIFPCRWGFFGGEVNINENHNFAIKRELNEELKLHKSIKINDLRDFKTLRYISFYYSTKYKSIFYIYILNLNEKIILNEGYDCKFFSNNNFLKGGISKKNGVFYEVAEINLMKKNFFLAKKFI